MSDNELNAFILRALEEDTGEGDHSSLASVPASATGRARLLIKEKGIMAGIRVAPVIFRLTDPSLKTEILIEDGRHVSPGDMALTVEGKVQSILRAERLVLNIMQRMSGIATSTAQYVEKVKDTGARITDTRKTTPGMRALEKEAVRIGGGINHRMGLYDMIMLKDNHTDYAGGITEAITRTREYLRKTGLNLKIEVESRNLKEVNEILEAGGADRIMLDNFSVPMTAEAVKMIGDRCETESSGGITLANVRDYALCGVGFISIGALTHHIKSLDMSLKAF
ncbi:MAG: carboxylating nicotinate-nucleotide diphosphorylase [Bacteroidales bacterium]|jgi:nicotinate-nucleotide pyrophosphorylase (carboxylating)|nr:carboxylating nicotinate-nucleotide diphosphorylase [Bacteroidales bacterium]